MTRAWCSNSAPQNIMSSLFQYSINEVKEEWKKLKEKGGFKPPFLLRHPHCVLYLLFHSLKNHLINYNE